MKNTEKRTRKIDARFTEEEYKLVLEMEKTLGIRKSDLVRNSLLKNKAVVINARELIAGLDQVGAELGRSGNNINQLAKYANILQLKEILSAEVAEQFNGLLEQYLGRQKELEVVLRKIIRTML
ncbi:MobC family plasmid mobilization relaxosome protein [Mucilaginibacter corticis]|uniref:MobC family plasmid mobilization relaxosome protein n=1 Tax=Mucilaginibacter corticis TaxID=2597670 RepID=A0A556MIL1_9SPHI|nr:plasmid mobilization relaxosome protein MobC [Mucilaginibacter corticis]TSJ39728.1 MobC family plasmid mobilization relaxosome protein [Mucilaginibacter corticis]